MRFMIALLLPLVIPCVFAKGHVNEPDTHGWNAGINSSEDISPVLPDVDDFASQKYYENNGSDRYSRWDKTDFRLYNPHFDDNHENGGINHNNFTN